MPILSIQQLGCLESVIFEGWAGIDDRGPRRRCSADRGELRLYELYVFGHRVMDVGQGPLLQYRHAQYDARKRIDLPLNKRQVRMALELIAWIRDGGSDTAMLRHGEQLGRLEEALAAAEPGVPGILPPPTVAPGGELEHAQTNLEGDDFFTLLDVLKYVFIRGPAPRRKFARLVGQQKMRGAFWSLYACAVEAQSTRGREPVTVSLPLQSWTALRHFLPIYAFSDAMVGAADEGADVNFVDCIGQQRLLLQLPKE